MNFLRFCSVFFLIGSLVASDKVLRIYTWYDYIPSSLVKTFESQTGIKVYMDFFDSSAVLESQLLAKNSGYDLVVPGAYPYAQRHIQKNLYQKIDKQKIPNLEHLAPNITENLKRADPNGNYLIPYVWGIVGLGVNRETLNKVLPDFKGKILDLIFDPQYAQKLAPYGIYLNDEPLELFASMLVYLGFDADSSNEAEIQQAFQQLRKVRPYVRKFDMYRGIPDLANHEVAIIQTYNMHVTMSKESQPDPEKSSQLDFLIPEHGVSFWVDCFAIPASAKNVDAAHQFLNFLLKPEHCAEVTKATLHPTANVKSLDYLPKEMVNDPILFPDIEKMPNLYVATTKDRQHERHLSRLMMKLKTGY